MLRSKPQQDWKCTRALWVTSCGLYCCLYLSKAKPFSFHQHMRLIGKVGDTCISVRFGSRGRAHADDLEP